MSGQSKSKRFEMSSLVVHATKLPPAPQVYGRLVAAINDGDCSLDRMAELVRLDTAISSQLLRIANSVIFGFRTQAASVEEAVLRVGLKELHRIVGLCASFEVFQGDTALYGTTANQLWQNAITTAVAMEKLAHSTGADPALAYTTGLLRSIGKMVLARHAAGTVEPFVDEGIPLPEWENRTFGVNYAQVDAALCELWRFPKPIANALRDHLSPLSGASASALPHLLVLASLVATRLGRGLPGEAALWDRDPVRLEKAGVEEYRLDDVERDTVFEVDRMTMMLGVHLE